jgi:hypothetical protein
LPEQNEVIRNYMVTNKALPKKVIKNDTEDSQQAGQASVEASE